MPKGKGHHVSGRRHPRANKLGVSQTKEGYIKVKIGASHPMADVNGWCYLHQLVAVTGLGRYLEPGELVHHEDEDRANNVWSNLEILTRPKHNALHNVDRGRDERGRFRADG
jgi:hypothetical protein